MDLSEAHDEYRIELFRYVSRHSGDPDFAEDVVQEAFVRLAGTKEIANVRRWLYTVATNIIRDQARSSERRDEIANANLVEFAPGVQPPALEIVEKKELRELVRAALDLLPERERTILLMREEGFSHREIAEAVDTTTGSVGTMIARAMKRLAGHLEEVRELVT